MHNMFKQVTEQKRSRNEGHRIRMLQNSQFIVGTGMRELQ